MASLLGTGQLHLNVGGFYAIPDQVCSLHSRHLVVAVIALAEVQSYTKS